MVPFVTTTGEARHVPRVERRFVSDEQIDEWIEAEEAEWRRYLLFWRHHRDR